MTSKTYEIGSLQQYKYVVVLSEYEGNILLSRHKRGQHGRHREGILNLEKNRWKQQRENYMKNLVRLILR